MLDSHIFESVIIQWYCILFKKTHNTIEDVYIIPTLIPMTTRTQPYPYEHIRHTKSVDFKIDKVNIDISLTHQIHNTILFSYELSKQVISVVLCLLWILSFRFHTK